ncbi:helix-turn-helix domain-containing protein [Desulfosporosinus youngiae]|uniref:SOS response transcriptional repressor, RecA-mediated autopeptidase n=1 Tax=Desulfosporosinus youngiae DSM 17734 TaxID=768710 RepID=H5Y229_9FIRM|nr:LexA family transcriptional regulator [Desulfosporosinus youngiae]EHQ88227.1 SOS response transcriptional repressor, RecA-mediated autopeptidase [Desulfosporosinus youngiae DSM 17734]
MSGYFNKDLFGQRLLEIMKDNNDTTYSLAEYLHLSPSAISRYTTGDMAPKIPTVQAIAEKYGVRPSWLMGIAGESKYPEAKEVVKKIPILGTIAAGVPITAQEDIEGYEFVSENLDVDFCLRVKGDSMTGAYIFDGSIVFIRQQPDVETGEIAAVLVDGENATLKRVYKMNGAVILRAENPSYPDQIYTKKEMKEVRILGKAIRYISEVR